MGLRGSCRQANSPPSGPLVEAPAGKPNTHKVPTVVPAREQVSKVKLFSLKDFEQKITGCMLRLRSLAHHPTVHVGELGVWGRQGWSERSHMTRTQRQRAPSPCEHQDSHKGLGSSLAHGHFLQFYFYDRTAMLAFPVAGSLFFFSSYLSCSRLAFPVLQPPLLVHLKLNGMKRSILIHQL